VKCLYPATLANSQPIISNERQGAVSNDTQLNLHNLNVTQNIRWIAV